MDMIGLPLRLQTISNPPTTKQTAMKVNAAYWATMSENERAYTQNRAAKGADWSTVKAFIQLCRKQGAKPTEFNTMMKPDGTRLYFTGSRLIPLQ